MNIDGAIALLIAGGAAAVANLLDEAAERSDLKGPLEQRLRAMGWAEHLPVFASIFEESGITQASVRAYLSDLEDNIRKRENRHVTQRKTGLRLRWDIADAWEEQTLRRKRYKRKNFNDAA